MPLVIIFFPQFVTVIFMTRKTTVQKSTVIDVRYKIRSAKTAVKNLNYDRLHIIKYDQQKRQSKNCD